MWGVYRYIRSDDGEETAEEPISKHTTQPEAEAEAARLTAADPNGPYTYGARQL